MPVLEVASRPGAESTRKASKLPKFDGSSWAAPHKKQALHHGSLTRLVGSQYADHGESLEEKMGWCEREPTGGQHHQRGIT